MFIGLCTMSIANMKRMHQIFLTKEKILCHSQTLGHYFTTKALLCIKRKMYVTEHSFKTNHISDYKRKWFLEYPTNSKPIKRLLKVFFHVGTLFLVKLIRRSTRKIRISRKSTLQFTINNILQPWAILFHRHIPLKAWSEEVFVLLYIPS